jgi:dTDP-4-amino-4,6-dideoxygalactose transaminase
MTKQAKKPELAIFTGKPAFAEKLHVGRPNIGSRERLLARMTDMLDRRWLTNNGPYVQEFEKRLCEVVGTKHCIPVCNATIALEIAIRALGLQGEVIVPAFTFIATAHALQWQQITPVFADVDPATHNIDPAKIESLITPRTTGILATHVWGRPCATAELEAIAARRKLTLMFDAAHAFACSIGERMIGQFGDAEVFSFHATKFLNSFEGGAIATNNDDLAGRIRLMKNFGFAGYDNVIYIGTNGKMNEISAAMGLTSLESMAEFIEDNRRNHELYQQGLEGIPGVQLTLYDSRNRNNYQYLVLEIDQEQTGISRDDLVSVFWAENVMARRYFYPGCHRMEPYRSYFPHAHLLLPETEKLVKRVLLLPTGTAVGSPEIARICSILRTAISEAPVVLRHLAAQYARPN